MLIVSQNKKTIILLENIKFIQMAEWSNTYYLSVYLENKENVKIGEYFTEKRTKEILLDIANAYSRGTKIYEMPEE